MKIKVLQDVDIIAYKIEGDSTDTKPTTVPINSIFEEKDTGATYKFVAGAWVLDAQGKTSTLPAAVTGAIAVVMNSVVKTITPTETATINASGGVTGAECTFIITTSGTSSFTLTFGTNFKSTGTLATGTASGKVFVINFICKDGTTWLETSRTTAM